MKGLALKTALRLAGLSAVLMAPLFTPGAPARAQADAAPSARQVALAAAPSVVTIQVVSKITTDEGPEDSKSEATGVVVDPSGLTVTSLSSLDPTELMRQLMGEDPDLQITVSDVKIRLGSGQEIPAKIVLRDKDQDLAFLRPIKKPEQPMAAVDLKNAATRELLDPVILVGRMGRVANRILSARRVDVEGVLERPRRRYILPGQALDTDSGSLAIAPDGKVVGIVGSRAVKVSEGDLSMMGAFMLGMGRGSGQMVVPTIIPAADIAPVAAQAPQDAPKADASARPAPKADAK